MPSKRARKIPEKIQVSKEDVEELTVKTEEDINVVPDAEVTSEETELSLDELKDNEVNTEDTDPTNS